MLPHEENLLGEARSFGILCSAGSDAAIESAPLRSSLPVNLTPRYCCRQEHRLMAFWGEDGRLVCGACRPPHPNVRWVALGGPSVLVDLTVTPTGQSQPALFTPSSDAPRYDPKADAEAQKKASPPRKRRNEASVDQISLTG
jgi:hypothetical protein